MRWVLPDRAGQAPAEAHHRRGWSAARCSLSRRGWLARVHHCPRSGRPSGERRVQPDALRGAAGAGAGVRCWSGVSKSTSVGSLRSGSGSGHAVPSLCTIVHNIRGAQRHRAHVHHALPSFVRNGAQRRPRRCSKAITFTKPSPGEASREARPGIEVPKPSPSASHRQKWSLT